MKKCYVRRKNSCVETPTEVSKTVFCIGALNRVLRSTVTVIMCSVLGFVLGVGSTIITVKLQMCQTDRRQNIDSLARYVEQRQNLDQKIEACIRHIIQTGTYDCGASVNSNCCLRSCFVK